MFVSDLRHFLDIPDDAPGPAKRMAEHLTLIVRAATAGDAGASWVTALPCRRRPGRRPCPGHIEVARTDVPPSLQWRCTSCGDEGVISGWAQSPFDLRSRRSDSDGGELLHVAIDDDVAGTLRGLMLLDTTSERLVFQARPAATGVILATSADDLDELIGCVAAEANHEENRRRQKRLDSAFEVLNDAMTRAM